MNDRDIDEKNKIRQCFNKAAHSYDAAALLQKEVVQQLLNTVFSMSLKPQNIIDIGSGTGYFTRMLAQHYSSSHIIGLDFAHSMTALAKKSALSNEQYLCADFEAIPLQDNTMDLIVSNLAIQWALNFPSVLREWHRILKPNATLIFSTFGKNTLNELRHSWSQIDEEKHVNSFLSLSTMKAQIERVFSFCEIKTEYKTIYFNDVFEIMRNLKNIGASHVINRSKNPFKRRDVFALLEQNYQSFAVNNRLPTTYELVYFSIRK